MAADDPLTQGARASSATALTLFSWNILASGLRIAKKGDNALLEVVMAQFKYWCIWVNICTTYLWYCPAIMSCLALWPRFRGPSDVNILTNRSDTSVGHTVEYRLCWSHGHMMATSISQHIYRDHFVHAPSQWEATLHCNVGSLWLGACTKSSLLICSHGKSVNLWGTSILTITISHDSHGIPKSPVTWLFVQQFVRLT